MRSSSLSLHSAPARYFWWLSATIGALFTLLAGCVSQIPRDPSIALDVAPLTGKASPLRAGDRLAFLGDSITKFGERPQGYIWLLEQELAAKQADKKVELIKAGIGGNKVPDLQQRLEHDVLSQHPTIVFVYIGINDVWHWTHYGSKGKGTTKEEFESGLADIITHIRSSGAVVVLATPSVIGEKPDGANLNDAMLDAYADISRKVAKEKGVILCDLRAAFTDYLKAYNSELQLDARILTVDTVHLSDRGNRLVANCAAVSLAQALRRRNDRAGTTEALSP